MADIDYPLDLQQDLNTSGYNQELSDNLIQSSVDVGIPKTRPRFTVQFEPVRGAILVDANEKQILKNFYVTTLSFGSKRFNWIDPVDKTPAEFKFTSPPSFASFNNSPTKFVATLSLNKLP